ncbi:uncharacterized protein MONBRDRAFT_813, partial [Monosiga brevicollis MX1]
DKRSVALLLLLYFLQGVPMGLSASVPYLLQDKTADYNQQALFSFVVYPFSLKLLWAPIVDGLFFEKFGRRKSWTVPCQILIALVLLGSSSHVDALIDQPTPDVFTLTILFLLLYTLCATQDVAVDGWALTMLSPARVDLASICNSVGQSAGYFTSFIFFLLLSSPDACNKYLRSVPSDEPMVTLGSFMNFFGWVFVLTTLGVWFFKREGKPIRGAGESTLSVAGTYQRLLQVCKLSSIQQLAFVILTCRIGFAGVESVTALKLQEFGVPKEDLASLGPLMFPVSLVVPSLMGYLQTQPMQLWLRAYPFRVLAAIPSIALVSRDPYTVARVLGSSSVLAIASTIMFTAQMQFFCKLSDPLLGGTYMTLLTTLANLGAVWPSTLAL